MLLADLVSMSHLAWHTIARIEGACRSPQPAPHKLAVEGAMAILQAWGKAFADHLISGILAFQNPSHGSLTGLV